MISDIFNKLQNKVYYDTRDFPVTLTEEHYIDGEITEANRKIKLSEKCHSFDNLIIYKIFKTSDDLAIKLVDYDNLAIYYRQVDLTVEYSAYDSTHDIYYYKITLFRSDTLESWNETIPVNGTPGVNTIIHFSNIWGNFSILTENFILGAKAIIAILGYESAALVVDGMTTFIGRGATTQLFFNIPANSVYINSLPIPFSNGNIYLLVRYMGLGSVITAESLNDIVNVVKYFNMMPKFEVEKVNNNDIKIYIRGEYYYMGNYVEKIDDAVMQIEDEVLIGQQNALAGILDIPNHIFNVRRISVGATYNLVLADLTEYIVENPDTEIPMFIIIFDTNKNVFEYAYVKGLFSSGGGSGINKYAVNFNSVLNISFSMLTDKPPLIQIYDDDGMMIIPNSIEVQSNFVEITFNEAQTGMVVAIN